MKTTSIEQQLQHVFDQLSAGNIAATERVCRQILLLPTGNAISEADIARIAEIIGTTIANGPVVRRRIGRLNCKS